MRAAGTDIIYCSGLVPEKFAGLARPLGKLTIVRGVVLFVGRVLRTMPFCLLVAGGSTVLHVVRCYKLGESTCKTGSSPMDAPRRK